MFIIQYYKQTFKTNILFSIDCQVCMCGYICLLWWAVFLTDYCQVPELPLGSVKNHVERAFVPPGAILDIRCDPGFKLAKPPRAPPGDPLCHHGAWTIFTQCVPEHYDSNKGKEILDTRIHAGLFNCHTGTLIIILICNRVLQLHFLWPFFYLLSSNILYIIYVVSTFYIGHMIKNQSILYTVC